MRGGDDCVATEAKRRETREIVDLVRNLERRKKENKETREN